ncbi:MAG: hypothetical protein WD940_01905 [Patescibacteria group bacterium]
MMTLLTRKLIEEAIDLAIPSIRAIAQSYHWGPQGVYVAVTGRGLKEPIVRCVDITNAEMRELKRDFRAIALQKLAPAAREGRTSNSLVGDFPWLLDFGDSLYDRGAVSEGPGLAVAVSGLYGEADEAIGWIVWNIIRMLCLLAVKRDRDDGVNVLGELGE